MFLNQVVVVKKNYPVLSTVPKTIAKGGKPF